MTEEQPEEEMTSADREAARNLTFERKAFLAVEEFGNTIFQEVPELKYFTIVFDWKGQLNNSAIPGIVVEPPDAVQNDQNILARTDPAQIMKMAMLCVETALKTCHNLHRAVEDYNRALIKIRSQAEQEQIALRRVRNEIQENEENKTDDDDLPDGS